MSFNCTAHKQDCLHELPRSVDGGRWVIATDIGFDPDLSITYYFVVHTYPINGSTEFAFGVTVVNNETREQKMLYDSADTNALIPSSCRQHITAILQDFTRKLLVEADHAEFFMETFCLNLPPQALVKYNILTQIFSSIGYTVTPTPTTVGKYLWIMRKIQS